MLTRKESAIVQVLLRNDEDYVSSRLIAKEIGMSDRTVRTYLQKIGDKLEKKGATLSSQSGRGYCLSIVDEERFQSYWQQADKLVKEVVHLEEAIDRRHYIIHKLFLEAACPTLLELAEELYLSKTSISQILTEIKRIIAPYHLQLSINRKGITVIGEEIAIRHFIKDYFFMDSFQHSIFSLLQSNVLEESQFSDIILIVVEECRKEQLQLPDFVLHNLVVHLALMMSRIRLGKKITITPHQEGNSSLENKVASNILTRLSNRFSIHLPKEEVDYVGLHLHNRTLLNISENITFATHRELTQYLEESLEKLGRRLSLPLQKDTHLLDLMQAHFIPFLYRGFLSIS